MDFNFAIELQTASATYLNINSVTASAIGATPVSGYKVEQVNLAQSNVNGFLDSLAQRDGLDSAEAFLGARQVQLIVSVYGSSLSDFWGKVDALSGALAPYPAAFVSDDGFRKLRFSVPYSAGNRTLYLKVRPQSLPGYLVDRQTSVGDSIRGFAQRFTIVLIAKDPRKINDTASTGSISIASSTGSASITNNGTYVSYPTFTAIATAAGTATSSCAGFFTAVIAIPTGSNTVVINSEDRTVKIGSTLRMDLVLPATTALPSLQPGVNIVTVSITGSPGITAISRTFNEAWL
jgi:hypothetical protein